MRFCHVCGEHLVGEDTHLEKHWQTHSMCVCCKNLVLTRNLNSHERDCRGFQRFRPIIRNYEQLMLDARETSIATKAVTCFCGAGFNHQTLCKHQSNGSCVKRKCRVCNLIVSSMLYCEEHRCVSFQFIVFCAYLLICLHFIASRFVQSYQF